jgi:hypothetical protein
MVVMNMKYISIILLASGWTLALLGQQVHRTDTFKTDPLSSHMFLNLDLPSGEIFLRSSGLCGTSISSLISPDAQILQHVNTQKDHNGNQLQKISVQQSAPAQSELRGAAATMRFAEQVTELNPLSGEMSFRTEYHLDPTFSTDLYVNLGVGSSELDLSGLSLQNVSVNSAFSDIYITYREPNQLRMKELDIHTAKADIVLEHAELADAELITIQNDMGATEVILGDKRLARSTIYLQAGVGSCTLKIAKGQPVHIVLRSGMFATVEVGDEFVEKEKGVYVNATFEKQGNKNQATRIICNIDFGHIQVEETD